MDGIKAFGISRGDDSKHNKASNMWTNAFELCQSLAEELGFDTTDESIASTLASTILSSEAVSTGLELVLPSMASAATAGLSSAATGGITLALIHRKVRELTKKLDLITESSRKTAKDMLEEAMVAFENENYRDAHEWFGKAGEKCSEAFNQSQDNFGKLLSTKMKLLSLLMVKSYDNSQQAFMPFQQLPANRQKELAMHMRRTVEKLLEEYKPTFALFKNKVQRRKIEINKLNSILASTYPFLTVGLGWTNPMEKSINMSSDVMAITIDPKFVPEGKEEAVSIALGKDSESGSMVTVDVYKIRKGSKDESLVVQSAIFPVNNNSNSGNINNNINSNNRIMLEFFRGKIAAFRDENTLLLSACRIGNLDVVRSLFKSNPNIISAGVVANHKGETPLITAIKNSHTAIVWNLLSVCLVNPATADNSGANALHHSAETGMAEVAEWIVEKNPDLLLAKDAKGATPLSIASEFGHTRIVKYFLLKSDLLSLPEMVRNDGTTPLFHAAANNHLSVAKLLLRYSFSKLDPLWVASKRGHLNMVKLLASGMSGKEVKEAVMEGISAKEAAALLEDKTTFKYLREKEKGVFLSRFKSGSRRNKKI